MNIKFKIIRNNHQRIRDEVITGQSYDWPKIGKRFWMDAPPRDKGDVRVINTSKITEIIHEEFGLCIFKTESSSIYAVQFV